MDIKQLRYFVAVVESEGFRAASERVHITQPAISNALAKLEDELGVRLIDRSYRDLKPTPEGDALYQHAKSILKQMEAARDDVLSFAGLKSGTVRIGAPVMIATYILPKLVWAFMRRFPQIRFEIREMGGIELESALHRGTVELGFSAGSRIDDAFDARLLTRSELMVGMSKTHPLADKETVTWKDLIAHRMAMFGNSYHIRRLVEDRAEKLGRPLDIAFEAETPELLIGACQHANALTLLLEEALEREKRIVKKPLTNRPKLPVSVVWRKAGVLSAASGGFLASMHRADA